VRAFDVALPQGVVLVADPDLVLLHVLGAQSAAAEADEAADLAAAAAASEASAAAAAPAEDEIRSAVGVRGTSVAESTVLGSSSGSAIPVRSTRATGTTWGSRSSRLSQGQQGSRHTSVPRP
jgi:hypothetical protein